MSSAPARLLSVALFCSCATAQYSVSPQVSADVARKLTGSDRYARISFFVTPFFGDNTKLFLSPSDPQTIDLVNRPDGTAISPGAPIRIVEAGTPIRVEKVEFPSSRVMSERVLTTPRTLVWIYVSVAGSPNEAPSHVLVLRPNLSSEAALYSEIERYLSETTLNAHLAEMSAAERKSISNKTANEGIGREALEMALGYPDQKTLTLEGEKQREVWRWGLGKNSKSVKLTDGLVSLTP